jgi:hypothetical protein
VLGRPAPGKTREQALPELIERMAARVRHLTRQKAADMFTAAFILSTMHVPPQVARGIINKVIAMEDFPGYLMILEEGAVKHTRELILKQGRVRLGEPTEKQKNKLNAIEDLDRLDRIALKVLSAKSWDALLRVQ